MPEFLCLGYWRAANKQLVREFLLSGVKWPFCARRPPRTRCSSRFHGQAFGSSCSCHVCPHLMHAVYWTLPLPRELARYERLCIVATTTLKRKMHWGFKEVVAPTTNPAMNQCNTARMFHIQILQPPFRTRWLSCPQRPKNSAKQSILCHLNRSHNSEMP